MRFSCSLLVVCGMLSAMAGTIHAQPSIVVLVRHAERAATPTADPALTEAGMQRALALKAVLADAGVSSIVTTQLQRTRLTAKPLGDALGLSPVVVRAGGPLRMHLDSVAATVRRQPEGSVVLVVGHSNTIPGIIATLGGPKMTDLCDGQYASLFVLEYPRSGGPRLIRASYGPPDQSDADGCARNMRE